MLPAVGLFDLNDTADIGRRLVPGPSPLSARRRA